MAVEEEAVAAPIVAAQAGSSRFAGKGPSAPRRSVADDSRVGGEDGVARADLVGAAGRADLVAARPVVHAALWLRRRWLQPAADVAPEVRRRARVRAADVVRG